MQQLVAKTPVEAEVLKSELMRYRFTVSEGKKPYTVITSAPPIVVESIVRAKSLDIARTYERYLD